jgi:ssRNA-specific RNase YbeY (16S rRNA maturation enzyme)
MANIKKDIDIPNLTVDKKRYKFTGLNYDSATDVITITYDVWALNASNVELFKHSQGEVAISQNRFAESHIAAFLSAGTTLITTELPNT